MTHGSLQRLHARWGQGTSNLSLVAWAQQGPLYSSESWLCFSLSLNQQQVRHLAPVVVMCIAGPPLTCEGKAAAAGLTPGTTAPSACSAAASSQWLPSR